MGDVMKEAAFSLAEAKFTSGDFIHLVLQNANKAQIKVHSRKENVAGNSLFFVYMFVKCQGLYIDVTVFVLFPLTGVSLPVFESYTDGSDSK